MPQRAKTPPPPQDEVFMTIHYPYPQHANMEIEEDVQRVAQWLGSIVKPAYFNAFYHKPSARNTVIIEVSKTILEDDKRKLLGQHIWRDILTNPTDGEKGHKSGIFYCVYNNIRDVQKEGWKRIDFEDTWFMRKVNDKYTSIHYDQAKWERIVEDEGTFRIPYPLSSRCEVPMEDPTNRGFCRPLPVDLFPIPILPEMPKEVPGTLKWAKMKALPESTWAKAPPKAIKGKAGSQATAQPKDQRGRTAAPRNHAIGLPVAPINSGVNHKSPGSLPPDLIVDNKGKGKQKETGEPSSAIDELMTHTLAMELNGEEEDKEYQEYYGAGMENVLSAGVATSPALPPDHDPIDHTGVGVHVSGVTVKPVVIEDSLWGDPLENINKKTKKDDDVPLCDSHGKICSRGICKVYEKQLREWRGKQKDSKEPRDWRNKTDGQNNGRGGPRTRGGPRGRGLLLRGSSGNGEDFGPRSPTDENRAPRKPNGITLPRNARSRPNANPPTNSAWGANNNTWSKSEMGESAKPADKSGPNQSAGDENGGIDRSADPPTAQDWSKSELGGSSQGDPWSRPAKAKDKSNDRKNEPGETRGQNSVGPSWGAAGAKNWTPSELGMEDSVSQRGDDGFRTAPNRDPGKKSWADLVEDGDEMDYSNADGPAPMVVPEPDPAGGDEDDEAWTESRKGKGKGKGKGRGKARSATGWSDVTNQGPW